MSSGDAEQVVGEIEPGAPVEVRNRSFGSWSTGFAVEGVEPEGYVVRRVSDGQRLPVPFAPDDVRPLA